MKINSYCFVLTMILLPIIGNAQSGTTSTGHTVSNTNYQIGFTVGESVISSYTDTGISVSNGIIQPIKGVVISTDDLVENNISVFPNPVSSIISIESEDQDLKTFEIFSLDSKLVHSGLINKETIDVSAIQTGMYILRLKSSQKTYSTLIKKINI